MIIKFVIMITVRRLLASNHKSFSQHTRNAATRLYTISCTQQVRNRTRTAFRTIWSKPTSVNHRILLPKSLAALCQKKNTYESRHNTITSQHFTKHYPSTCVCTPVRFKAMGRRQNCSLLLYLGNVRCAQTPLDRKHSHE